MDTEKLIIQGMHLHADANEDRCGECAYEEYDSCSARLADDALKLIFEKNETIKALTAQLNQALKDMKTAHWCGNCKHHRKENPWMCYAEACHNGDMWVWRGVRSDNILQEKSALGKNVLNAVLENFMKGVERHV